MKGNLIYAVVVATIALLAVFEHFLLFSSMFAALCFFLFFWKRFTLRQLCMLLSVFFIFLLIGKQAEADQKTAFTGEETKLYVRFLDEIKIDGDRLSAAAIVVPQGEKVAISYRIKSAQEKESLKRLMPGTQCNVNGSLKRAGQSRNPNSFDYSLYLERQSIFWILEPDTLNEKLCMEGGRGLVVALKKFRQQELMSLTETLKPETAAIFAALLFGERGLMSPETEAGYTRTGTVHLLAISGLHVALLSGMCYYLLLFLGLTREKVELILLIILPLYAVLTGLAPPVNRAVTMLMIFLIARKFAWKISTLDVISIAFLILIFPVPYVIYEPGFQLSFSVSIALVLSARKIFSQFHSYFAKLAAVSIVSQLASLPILLVYFYEVSIISIYANLLFVPLFSLLLLPLIIISYLFSLSFPFGFKLLLPIVEMVVSLSNVTAGKLAALPFASLTLGKPGYALLLIYFVSIIAIFLQWEKGHIRKRYPQLLILAILPITIQLALPAFSPYGKVVFVDVGQGDSIFIQLPFNRGNYLIDAGGTISFNREEWQERRDPFEVGKNVLVPFLKSEGIRKIDKLILTHGDMDHVGGAKAVLNELKVEEILFPAAMERTGLELELMEMAREKKVSASLVGKGSGWAVGNDRFLVVSPMERLADKNEGSIVLYADFGGKTWLFTGDVGQSGEGKLIQQFPNLSVDVLKVGHHGSHTSSSVQFIEAIAPSTAVISVGEGNRYGHPHHEVIQNLEEANIDIFRTDQAGAVTYIFKGNAGTFSKFIP